MAKTCDIESQRPQNVPESLAQGYIASAAATEKVLSMRLEYNPTRSGSLGLTTCMWRSMSFMYGKIWEKQIGSMSRTRQSVRSCRHGIGVIVVLVLTALPSTPPPSITWLTSSPADAAASGTWDEVLRASMGPSRSTSLTPIRILCTLPSRGVCSVKRLDIEGYTQKAKSGGVRWEMGRASEQMWTF